MRRIYVFLLIAALAIVGYSQEPKRDLVTGIFESYGFPPYAELTYLCKEFVLGDTGEIVWDGFASAKDPDTLLEFYIKKLGKKDLIREKKTTFWRIESKDRSARLLDIHSLDDDLFLNEGCKKKLPLGTRSVIIVSQFTVRPANDPPLWLSLSQLFNFRSEPVP